MPALTLEHFLPISIFGFPASFDSDLTESAASFIYDQQGEYDLIVISGDLATTGHNEYLRAARSYTHGTPSVAYHSNSGEPTIVAETKKKLVIPGNHDRFRNVLGASADPHFDLVFDGVWDPPIASRVLEKDGSHLAILGADFCLRQDDDAEAIVVINRAGRGRVYDDILVQLISKTRELKSKDKAISIIWALHFPPTENCPSKFKLIGSGALEDAAEKNSVQLFLSGHLHRNVEHRTRHGRPILCAGTVASSGVDGYNWIHFIEVEVEKGRISFCEKRDFRWDDTEGDFLEMEGREVSLEAIV